MSERVDKLKLEYIDIFKDMARELGYTQVYIADKMEVSPKTISKWFNKKNVPKLENIRKMAEVFDRKILF